MGAVGGSFLAARTHGADSLGMFQNTSHAPRLNFKKLGHLHVQNATGWKGKKEKNPQGRQSSQRGEGAGSTQRLMSCCGREFVAKAEQLQAALRRGRAQVSVEQRALACEPVSLLVEWGEWEEELELPRNGARVSACSSCPSGVGHAFEELHTFGGPRALQEEGGLVGGNPVFLMGMSAVLIPLLVLPGAAWDPAH